MSFLVGGESASHDSGLARGKRTGVKAVDPTAEQSHSFSAAENKLPQSEWFIATQIYYLAVFVGWKSGTGQLHPLLRVSLAEVKGQLDCNLL